MNTKRTCILGGFYCQDCGTPCAPDAPLCRFCGGEMVEYAGIGRLCEPCLKKNKTCCIVCGGEKTATGQCLGRCRDRAKARKARALEGRLTKEELIAPGVVGLKQRSELGGYPCRKCGGPKAEGLPCQACYPDQYSYSRTRVAYDAGRRAAIEPAEARAEDGPPNIPCGICGKTFGANTFANHVYDCINKMMKKEE